MCKNMDIFQRINPPNACSYYDNSNISLSIVVVGGLLARNMLLVILAETKYIQINLN